MWQFMVGFGIGMYIGTSYNCKPQIDNIIKIIKKNIQKQKNK